MNVIVVVADSLRVDHVGCYGGVAKTPNIDSLAEEAMVFDQAYGENLPTMPCRAAWWTGRHLFPSRGWQPFEPEDFLLAEALSSRGFASALVTDTYHMHRPGYNCGRGFDTTVFIRGQEYDPWVTDPAIAIDLSSTHRFRGDETDDQWRARFVQYMRNRSRFVREEDHCAPRVFAAAMDWLEGITRIQKDKLFLWIDSFSPHEPWDPPEPFRGMYDPGASCQTLIDPVPGDIAGYMNADEVARTKSLYAGCVSFVDKWCGIFLQRLKDLGLYENSLLIFTSDHGEPFGEHGIIRKARLSMYEELTHIPLIVRHPDGSGRGERSDVFTQPPDLAPSVYEACGVDFGPDAPAWGFAEHSTAVQFTGRSFLPVLKGKSSELWPFAVSAAGGRCQSIRTRGWTLLHQLPAGPDELYDRVTDPGEQVNLLDRHPEVASRLRESLVEFSERMKEQCRP